MATLGTTAVAPGAPPRGTHDARLIAVVATYRRPAVAREAIEALRGQTRPPDGIVLVENSSERDFTGVYDAGEVEVVHTGWNAGAAGGFGRLLETGFEWQQSSRLRMPHCRAAFAVLFGGVTGKAGDEKTSEPPARAVRRR